MYNPYMMPQNFNNTPQYNAFTQRCEIVKVNGKNGAEAYQMASNSSVLLLDETQPIVWLKQTDGAGYPTITPYKIEPYVAENPIASLEERIKRLEEKYNESYTEPARGNQNKQYGRNDRQPSADDGRKS